jgi:phage gpG-like protein
LSIAIGFHFDPSAAIAAIRKARQDVRGTVPPGPLRDGLLNAGKIHLKFLRRRFLSASRGGGTWKPLAASTLKQKKPNRGILRETDRLVDSLEPGHPDNILQVMPRGVRVGSKVPYLRFHQFGTGTIPKRVVVIRPDAATLRQMKVEIAKGLGLQARQWSKVGLSTSKRPGVFSETRIR